jgi:hypothetical protein
MNLLPHHCASDGSSLEADQNMDVSFVRTKQDAKGGPKITLQQFNIQINLSRGAL